VRLFDGTTVFKQGYSYYQ